MERFFSFLNRQLFEDTLVENRTVARQASFEDIDVCSAWQRRHATLGDLIPREFERQAQAV